jgi:glycerol-3-phosphate acyltransferase PlsY
VATALGILLVLNWPLGLAVAALWLVAFGASRISSLGSISGFVAAPFLCAWLSPQYLLGVTLMSLVLLARHHGNIRALLRGEERRFGSKKAASGPAEPGSPEAP